MLVLFVVGVAMIAGAWTFAAIAEKRDRPRWPPPGRFIDAGGCAIHLREQGVGDPVVVLEAGIAATSLSWSLVQPDLARFTRVCSYDRAGLGWSEPSRVPRTIHQLVTELDLLLSGANLPSPYVLVGHSFGALVIRAYAHSYPERVAGLVFVDPVSITQWADCSAIDQRRLKRGARLSRRGAFLARLGLVRATLHALASGQKLIPKLIGRASSGRANKVMENLIGEVRKLPPETWPIIRAHWSRAQSFFGMAAYLECLPASAREAQRISIPDSIPFTVLSAGNATESELRERDLWVAQSTSGRHVRVPNTGHWIHLERPDLVIEAALEFINTSSAPFRGPRFNDKAPPETV